MKLYMKQHKEIIFVKDFCYFKTAAFNIIERKYNIKSHKLMITRECKKNNEWFCWVLEAKNRRVKYPNKNILKKIFNMNDNEWNKNISFVHKNGFLIIFTNIQAAIKYPPLLLKYLPLS